MVTFIWVWVVQDILVFLAALVTIIFIVKNEENPEVYILEMTCFVLLNAAVYENFATLIGLYSYGRSSIMIFNVPLAVPLVEYLVIYTALRLLKYMEIPTWCKPFIVGLFGMLFDFSLDPVATKQIYNTEEGVISRWVWHIQPGDANIYGEPVYNFPGWVLLCGFGALFLLLGRYWYQKSNRKQWIGYVYPILTMLGALGLLVLPTSRFLLWLEPIFSVGSIGEWIMLGVHFTIPTVLLVFLWRGKMKSGFTVKSEYPIFITLIGFHLIDLFFAIMGGFWEILWLVILSTIIQSGLVLFIYFRGKTKL